MINIRTYNLVFELRKKEELQVEAVRLRQEERLSLKQIVDRLGVAKSSVSLWVRDYPLSQAEKTKMMSDGQKRAAKRPSIQKANPEAYGALPPIKKGKAAELFFNMQCLLRNLSCFSPTTEDGRIDFIDGKSMHRIQVKVVSGKTGTMPVRKISCNSSTNVKQYRYSKDDVDFMVGVHLETLSIYICPIEELDGFATCVSVSTMVGMGFEDNFGPLFE